MAQEFGVVVIGSGSAGYSVASHCQAAGFRTALVESQGFGGTCPLRGCNPKKVLVNAAAAVARTWALEGYGLSNPSSINWPELIRFKRTFTEPKSRQAEANLKNMGVTTFHGRARFIAENRLQVGEDILVADYIFIGTGMVPEKLDIPGEEYVTTSDQFLELPELPEVVVFIGGGYISFEFAHVAARCGAKAIILHRSGTPLKGFDQEMVARLVELSRQEGIDIRTASPVTAVAKEGDSLVVTAGKDGKERIAAGLVVHGAGRVADIEGLNLAAGKVEANEAGVVVNEYLQSVSNPKIYAGGDAAATPLPLTPSAYLQGRMAAHNIIEGNTKTVDYTGIAQVVYTIPPLASVGAHEEDLQRRGVKYVKKWEDSSNWFSSRSIRLKHSFMKVLWEKDTGRILGAHLLVHRAEEVINIFGMAMRLGLTVDRLRDVIWTYPSSVSDVAYLLD